MIPAAASLLALLLAAPTPAGDLAEIRTRGVLRVIVWTANLPELYAIDGRADSGLEQEILQGFAALHHLKLAVVAVPTLDARLPALLEARGDLVAGGLVDTPSRRKQVDFSAELFPIRHVIVSRKPRPPIDSLEMLRLQSVGTVKGSSWADEVAAAEVPPKQVDTSFTSADELLGGLRSGKVSAVVMSAVWGLVAARKDPELQIGAFIGAPTSVGFAVRKEQPALRAALDEYIGNVRRTPTWSRLVVKYFGEDGLRILRASR